MRTQSDLRAKPNGPRLAAIVDRPPARAAGSAGRSGFSYHPGLDGLRGLAVLSVMAFHAGIVNKTFRWGGGWLGVDLFFVLSGFLITRLLLEEFVRLRRVHLGRFYLRRLLRLYPLIAVVVAGAIAVRACAPAGSPLRTTRRGIVAIAGYFANWEILRAQTARQMGMWSHLWTLSIEEQFYVVWPILLVALLLAGGRARVLLLVTVGIAVAVAVYRWRVARVAYPGGRMNFFALLPVQRHWYYSSFTHTDGLMAGAALAVWTTFVRPPGRIARRALVVAGPSAFGALVGISYLVGRNPVASWVPYWGVATFNLGSVAMVASLVTIPRARWARPLRWRPLVWMGRRSYGIYVFNLPILAVLHQRYPHLGERVVVAGTLLTLVSAGVSYRWYERPFLRLKDRLGRASDLQEPPRAAADDLVVILPPSALAGSDDVDVAGERVDRSIQERNARAELYAIRAVPVEPAGAQVRDSLAGATQVLLHGEDHAAVGDHDDLTVPDEACEVGEGGQHTGKQRLV